MRLLSLTTRHSALYSSVSCLGCASWITDVKGIPVQHMQYLPWGEVWMDERAMWYKERFTFSGKERDAETGLHYFGFRYLNSMLSIWTGVDPLSDKYPSMSPYAYCGNNPVGAVDLRGDSITTVSGGITYYYGQHSSGEYGFMNSSGDLYSGDDKFVSALTGAIDDLRNGGPVGKWLVNNLVKSKKTTQVCNANGIANANGLTSKGNASNGDGTVVFWNPNISEGGPTLSGSNKRPAFISLGHEFVHVWDAFNGTYNHDTWFTIKYANGMYNSSLLN